MWCDIAHHTAIDRGPSIIYQGVYCCVWLARCPLQYENSLNTKYTCDSQKNKRLGFSSSSRLRVRHHAHCRLAQYKARINTNTKASLRPETVSQHRPACTTHRHRSHIHFDPNILCTDKARTIFMKHQHPGRRSEISSDNHQQNQ